MPPLSANAEPCGEVTCRCLALLCAPGSVGAQSVARRLGPSRWVRGSRRRWWRRQRRRRLQAGGSERDAAGGRGRVLAATPCWRAAGGAAGSRGAVGRGSLRFVCGSGGASALSPLPGGAAVVGRGRGLLGELVALAPGCRRGDNRGRRPSFGPHLPPGAAPLGSPLSEGAGRRPQGAAPERLTPHESAPVLAAGGADRLGGGRLEVKGRGGEPMAEYPTVSFRVLPHPPSCGEGGGRRKVFLAGVGGGVRTVRAREGRSYPDRTVSPAYPAPSHARGLRGVVSSGRFEKARGGRGRGQGPVCRAFSDWPGAACCFSSPGPGPRPPWVGC